MKQTQTTFNFRAPSAKQTAQNAEENLPAPIKRAPVAVTYNALEATDIINILNGSDELSKTMLLEIVNNVIEDQIRAQLDEQPNYTEIDLSKLDESKFDWATIAAMPKASRRSSVPSDEDFEAFKSCYIEVMSKATDGSEKQIKMVNNAANIFMDRCKVVRSYPDKIKKLSDKLDLWLDKASEQEASDNSNVYFYLKKRMEKMLQTPSSLDIDI